MPVQKPFFKKCCCCLPLRPGILIWCYIRLILALTGAFSNMFVLLPRNTMPEFVIFIIVCFFADAAIVTSTIAGGHMKNVNILKFSIFYNILWSFIILGIVGYLGFITFARICPWCPLMDEVFNFLKVFIPGFSAASIQFYVILLTRSEIIKLQNQALQKQSSKNAYGEARFIPAGKEGIA